MFKSRLTLFIQVKVTEINQTTRRRHPYAPKQTVPAALSELVENLDPPTMSPLRISEMSLSA